MATVKELIEAITAHPERFDPKNFRHCGLRALVEVCQSLQEPKPVVQPSRRWFAHLRVLHSA